MAHPIGRASSLGTHPWWEIRGEVKTIEEQLTERIQIDRLLDLLPRKALEASLNRRWASRKKKTSLGFVEGIRGKERSRKREDQKKKKERGRKRNVP